MNPELAHELKERIDSSMDLKSYLKVQRDHIDEELRRWFQGQAEKSEKIIESVTYSLFSASKRIRPIFCLETCKALLGDDEAALPAAMALEMVHTYSLIHDDLPAMDDDDLRRGKPTNHKVYGEANAILAGDALLTYAFEVLSSSGRATPAVRIAWLRELTESAGANGMVLGQAWDIAEEKKAVNVDALEQLHRKKTGALLSASVVMGAIAAEASAEEIESLRAFAGDMGLAFQIQDDIIDVVGGVEIGKTAQSDIRNEKTTYVSLLGLESAKREAEKWFQQAISHLRRVNFQYENRLEELTRFVVDRGV